MSEASLALAHAALTELPRVRAFVAESCERLGAAPDERDAVVRAVDEVYSNVVQHGYAAAGGPLLLQVCGAEGELHVLVHDRAPPFDPDRVPPPDLASSWDRRPLGGLGWHLVRASVDEVRWEEPPEGGNRVTLVKRLAAGTGDAAGDDRAESPGGAAWTSRSSNGTT